jgi:8-oxo-dGTP diphosphatase
MAAGLESPAAQEAPVLDVSEVTDPKGRVRAAGGIVLRGDEVLLVHRPRYDDWSFPKGKARSRRESDAATALREVREETGLACELGEPLPDVTYTDSLGRPKVVRYWRMLAGAGTFEPGDEVDEVRWLPVDEARRLLTYDHDRVLLDALGVVPDA